MDPQQEFFTELRARLKTAYPGMVYDTRLPKNDTPYPFIYLGGSSQRDSATKSVLLGYATQSVRVWHSDPHKRGTVSAMLSGIKTAARSITQTAHYQWRVEISVQDITDDATVRPPLLMGILEITAHFSPIV